MPMIVLLRLGLIALATTTTLAVDLDGRPVTQLAPAGSRAVVLFFAASDCPVSNRYIPEIQRLTRQFEPSGAGFGLFIPTPEIVPRLFALTTRSFPSPRTRHSTTSRLSRSWRMRLPPRR